MRTNSEYALSMLTSGGLGQQIPPVIEFGGPPNSPICRQYLGVWRKNFKRLLTKMCLRGLKMHLKQIFIAIPRYFWIRWALEFSGPWRSDRWTGASSPLMLTQLSVMRPGTALMVHTRGLLFGTSHEMRRSNIATVLGLSSDVQMCDCDN